MKILLTDSFVESWYVFFKLCNILIPVVVVLKIIEPLGLVELSAQFLEDSMQLVGLPGYTALIWASAMLGNIYTAVVVLVTLWHQEPLSVAQVSILSLMILVAHNLIVETVVAHKSGSNIIYSAISRIISAYVMGWIAFQMTSYFNIFQEPAKLFLKIASQDKSWLSWGISQVETLVTIFVVIFLLTLIMTWLKKKNLEQYLHLLLKPLLKMFGLKKNSANITLIGLILGIAYGAAFLINDVQKKKVNHAEGFKVLNILNINHSLLEDTLLMLLLGTSLWIILVFRVVVGIPISLLLCVTVNTFPVLQKMVITSSKKP